MKLAALSSILISLGLAACGGDDGGVNPVIDAARVDAASVDAPVACTVSTAMFGDRGAVVPSMCIQDPGQDPAVTTDDVIIMRAPLQTGSPFDELEFDLYAGYGVFTNGFVPGTFQIAGDELQFFTCGLCVFVNSQRADPQTYVDDYYATGGTVTISSIAGTLTGTVSNLTFEHVTLANNETTPVGDGCVTAVAGATFTAPITAPPAKRGQAVSRRVKSRIPHHGI